LPAGSSAPKRSRAISPSGRAHYETVLADIDDQHASLKTHVGSLEVARAALDQVIDRITATYGDPNDGSSEQGGSSEVGQVIDEKPA
jgi:hypothetical protein